MAIAIVVAWVPLFEVNPVPMNKALQKIVSTLPQIRNYWNDAEV